MIRSELVEKIAEANPHLYQRDVEKIVSTVFNEIIEALPMYTHQFIDPLEQPVNGKYDYVSVARENNSRLKSLLRRIQTRVVEETP